MYYVAHGQGGGTLTPAEIATFGSDFLGYGKVDLTSGGGFAWTPLTLAQNGFTPVPLPPSVLLLGSGILGLGLLGRWRKNPSVKTA